MSELFSIKELDQESSDEVYEVLKTLFPTLESIYTFFRDMDIKKPIKDVMKPIFGIIDTVENSVKEEYKERVSASVSSLRTVLNFMMMFGPFFIIFRVMCLFAVEEMIKLSGGETCIADSIPLESQERLRVVGSTCEKIFYIIYTQLLLGGGLTFPRWDNTLGVHKQTYHELVQYITEKHNYLLEGEYPRGDCTMQ